MAKITLQGRTIHTFGELPTVGGRAPAFSLVDVKLHDRTLADYQGKRKLLNIVPSLDTAVCAASAKKFNEAAPRHTDAVMLVISADLPFAQQRFLNQEKLGNIIPLSMMRTRNFAKDYGVLMTDGPLAGITARAVVIIDEDDRILYTELVPELTHEPDYSAALANL